jgi:hypothetical protein
MHLCALVLIFCGDSHVADGMPIKGHSPYYIGLDYHSTPLYSRKSAVIVAFYHDKSINLLFIINERFDGRQNRNPRF